MRKKKNFTRIIKPDPKFNSPVAASFINHLMRDGKKVTAQKVFYSALDIIEAKSKQEPISVLDMALNNVSPRLEVKSRRVGGANYQVPREVRGERRLTLAMRWLIQAARAGKGKPMREKLASELLLASKNEGAAIKKKLDMQRMAEANKAFARFSW